MKIRNKYTYMHHISSFYMLFACLFAVNTMVYSQEEAQPAETVRLEKPGTTLNEKQSLTTYAKDGIKGDEIDIPTTSLSNMLYGRIPGLIVSQGGGEPGNDMASMAIRGIGTYVNSSIPVFVDGFQIEMNYLQALSAFEIESVEVLKDASALAPFGMRGANGILWITTKRGKSGKPQVALQSRLGFQQATALTKPLKSEKYTQLYNEAISNDNGYWSPVYAPADGETLPNIDWHNEVLKETTPYKDVNLSVNGGNKYARYYVMLGYVGQNGLYNIPINDTLANASYNRYNIRTNLDLTLSKYIEAKIDLGGQVATQTNPNCNISELWSNMGKYPSLIYPVKSLDGKEWSGTTVYPNNPVAESQARGRVSSHQRSIQFNITLKEKLDFIASGLYLKERISISNWVRDGASNTRTYARYIDSIAQTTSLNTPYVRNEDSGNAQWSWQHFGATLGYDKQWKQHALSVSLNALYNLYNTDKARNGDAGLMMDYKYVNVNAALNYTYDNRYIVDVTLTASGSDNYKPGNQWGYYPTVGLGWVISNEKFFENKVIDFLKLRASAGTSGNDPMGEKRFLWQKYYSSQGGFSTGNGTPAWNGGLGMMYQANPSLFAEKSTKYDIGIDARLINKLSLELNGYMDKRSNILTVENMIPSTMGVTTSYSNVGSVTNKGFEAKLSITDQIGSLGYFATAMISYNDNTIDYMAEVVSIQSAARTGNAINSQFGYVADGFYDITDFDVAGKLITGIPIPTFGKVRPGDVKYKDMLVDGVIDENDQTKIGNSYLPKYTYSLQLGVNFKGIDISALVQSVTGRDVNLLYAPVQTIAFRNNGNVFPIAENRWAYYPEQNIDTRATATYPRLSTQDNNNNYKNSTLWIYNGDYLKIRNVEIGYSFPKTLLNKIKIEKLRIFISGVNLFEFSKLNKDFEMNAEVLTGYPAMKSYNAGLSLNF